MVFRIQEQRCVPAMQHALQNSEKELHHSHILKCDALFIFKRFKKGRRQAGNLFKLIGEMPNAAVMKFISNFSKIEFIIND